jgi:hypothetical protein
MELRRLDVEPWTGVQLIARIRQMVRATHFMSC